ncbi:hypothetical protein BXU10_10305 [Flavobacterium sp. LM4]|nr:hypothetical protein BXU10_10305 [Flavobacterium sp. LM4]
MKGDIQKRCRDILIQICQAEGIEILKGVLVQTMFICISNTLQSIMLARFLKKKSKEELQENCR